ncbi:MAG: hypothetical protein G3M70_07300 [Candidatus Nitronauta litoralis]|uniref:Uncharacterized protein n=1 Tax=Candidatus Nitronauta litoralis TaxID=2705533 RepID=A0A7T0BVP2_9BACT|nr:MAG: hypothetical protein G3M70_07300 [Candidatus Nitronauta litoralis]
MKPVLMDKEIHYVPECDRNLPTEDQTIFLLKPLSAKDAASMQDNVTQTKLGGNDGDTVMLMQSGTQALNALKKGLAGWENFKDAHGKEIEFRHNNGAPRPEMFDLIPAKVRQELANVIIEGCDISGETEKN